MPAPPFPTPLPTEVAAALERLQADLDVAAGTNLAGLILYGGLARGRFRAGSSDVNVVVLLKDASAESLAAIAPALRTAWRSVGVEPMLLTPAEVLGAADDFPTKFLDIRNHHVVLTGEDPFANLDVPEAAVLARIAQALRNLLLRLRRRYIAVGDDPAQLARVLASAARPLAVELGALLRIAGAPPPASDRTADIYAVSAVQFDLDGPALARLSALRQNPATADDIVGLYRSMLAVVERSVAVTDELRDAQR